MEWAEQDPDSFELVDRILALDEDGQPVEELIANLPDRLAMEVREVLAERRALALDVGIEPPATPSRIGRFEVRAAVAGGVQGQVYRAFDPELDREVAIKTLCGPLAAATIRRFEREARVLSRLQHHGICPVLEVGHADDRPFLVMPWLSGRSLADWLGAPPPGETGSLAARVRCVAAIARAVQVAHDHGIVHRDIKPANIQLTATGDPVVLDFGLARGGADDLELTQPGAVLGTPAYCSPEQLRGGVDGVDHRADIWALGVTLHEALLGARPFTASARSGLVRAICDDPVPIRPLHALDRDLRAILLTSLAKRPTDRYGSMSAFADDLEAWLSHRPIRARAPGPLLRAWRWSQRNRLAALLLAALGLTCGALLLVSHQSLDALAEARAMRWLAEARNLADRAPGDAMALAMRSHGRIPESLLDETVQQILARPVETAKVALPGGRTLRTARFSAAGDVVFAVATDGWLGYWPLEEPALRSADQAWRVLDANSTIGWLFDDAGPTPDVAVIGVTQQGAVLELRTESATDGFELRRRCCLTAEPVPFVAAAVAADGTALAAVTADGALMAIDLATAAAKPQQVTKGCRTPIAINATGDLLAWMGIDGQLRVGDATGRTLAKNPDPSFFGKLSALAFSSDGQSLVAASLDNRIHVFDRDHDWRCHHSLSGHGSGVHTVACHPTLPVAATGGADRAAILWQPRARRHLRTMVGHSAAVTHVAFDGRGEKLLTGDAEGRLKIWSLATDVGRSSFYYGGRSGMRTARIAASGAGITAIGKAGWVGVDLNHAPGTYVGLDDKGWPGGEATLALGFHPGGDEFVIANGDGSLEWRSVATGHLLKRTTVPERLHRSESLSLTVSPLGDRLLLTAPNGNAALLDGELRVLNSRCRGRSAHFSTGNVVRQAFVGTARFVTVAGTSADLLVVHDAHDGAERRTLAVPDCSLTALAARPGAGRALVAGGLPNVVVLVDDIDEGRFSTIALGHGVVAVRFDPSGNQLACAGDDGSMTILTGKKLQSRHRIAAHDGLVYDAVFDSTGQAVLTVSFDETVALFDAANGELRWRLQVGAPQLGVDLSPSGDWALATGINGAMHTFPLRPARSVRQWLRRD